MKNNHRSRLGQMGFYVVEALISMVVMGFGILALANMQSFISRGADISKQRTEAIRLAQQKIEEIRSFSGIATTATASDNTNATLLNWNSLASGNDTVATNATYARQWTIGGVAADPSRPLTVSVGWTDRAGEALSISLSTVLSKTDPRDTGFLGYPLPQNTNLKRPKNRNLDIPIPAVDLGNGNSAVKFGTTGQYIQFGNISGDIVSICSPSGIGSNPTNDALISALTDSARSNCISVNGYLLAGYVSKDSSMSSTDWNAVQGSLGIDTSGLTRNAAGNSGITCQFGDAVDQNSGAVIANYKYYMCVIPLAAPGTPITDYGPYNWSGKVKISGPASWRASGSKYFVCRLQYAATSTLTNVNQRNVQPYDLVNLSIDQQNYVIATTANGTSATAPSCPSSMTTTDVSSGTGISAGVLHQDCRSASNAANYTTDCPLSGAITTYAVTYNGNGATGGTVPVDGLSPYSNGSTVTVLGNTGSLTLSGKAFSGWNTAANGTGTAYAAGSSITNISAATTLYAQWTTAVTYTVTYDANGGSGTLTDTNSPYTSGTNVTTLPGSSFTRSGYSFSQWNTRSDGTGIAYSAGNTLSNLSANTTLYAQWVALPRYRVTYNSNDADSGSTPTDANEYVSGSSVTVLTNSGTLTKVGYSFNGWNANGDGTGTAYPVGSSFSISGNMTLYVKWARVVLTTPAPVWATSGTDPRSLSWTAVSGATSYLVASCKSTSASTCTPSGSSSQSTTTLTPPAMDKKDAWCYTITASGSPYANSVASGVKCVIQAASGSYSYQ